MKKNNITITSDDNETNDFLYCWNEFGKKPNKIKIYNSFLSEYFYNILEEYGVSRVLTNEIIAMEDFDVLNERVLTKINDELYVSHSILDKENENSFIHEVIFFFKNENEPLIAEITDRLSSTVLEFENDGDVNYLNTIYHTENGLELEPIEIKDLDDVDLYYNRTTIKSIDKLIKSIKKSSKGISLLVGERGTGKTSIISYLSSKIDRVVIFIPNSLVESTINNSEFRTFLKKYEDPIVVIDDCEVLFSDMYSKSSLYVNNILQMTEGLLSDSINVNFVLLFNTDDIEYIDQTLLDSNVLHNIIDFEYLTVDESNTLSKHLGFNKKYKNKARLIDIIKKNNTKSSKKIGF